MKKAVVIVVMAASLVFAAFAGAGAEGVFRIGSSDHVFVKGTHIGCGVSRNSTIATAITCFKLLGSKTKVGSFAVQVGDKYAALMRVTSTSGDTKPLAIKKQR